MPSGRNTPGVPAFGDGAAADVAVGHHADQPVVLADRKGFNVEFLHFLLGKLHNSLDKRENSVIFAEFDVLTQVILRASLANDD